jgi:hypothetical protein
MNRNWRDRTLKLSLWNRTAIRVLIAWNKLRSRAGWFGRWERTTPARRNAGRIGWGLN